MDFKKSLEKGLEAHRSAAAARAEIMEVLRKLEGDLSETANVKFSVVLGSSVHQIFRSLTKIQEAFGVSDRQSNEVDVLRIGTRFGTETKQQELFEFRVSDSGFPVTVGSGIHQEYCHDKESLVRGLSLMLEQPAVAGKIDDLTVWARERQKSAPETAPKEKGPGEKRDVGKKP
jgi:hypothetical protein